MARILRLFGVLAATLVVAFLSPAHVIPPAHAAFPGTNGKIVFQTTGNPTIETVDPDGSNQHPNGPGQWPRWSPDGSKIAFGRVVSQRFRIFISDADGSHEKDISTNDTLSEVEPAWSPDGSQIAFVGPARGPASRGEVWVMDADGSNRHSLTPSPPFLMSGNLDWSPDGKSILFSATPTESCCRDDLFTVNVANFGITDITNTPDEDETMGSWSPDGTQVVVVYQTSSHTQQEIRVISPTGGGQQTLLTSGFLTARWSPDGSRIVYSDNGSLFTIKSNGADKTPLGVNGTLPDWQPTTLIVFLHGFLGSRIVCGSAELWPNIPPGPNFDNMRLLPNGMTNPPATCGATVGDILDTVLGSSIYKSAMDFLNKLAPGNAYFFAWDWRSSPQKALADLDAYIDNIRTSHPGQKVVIMAHSYGGLLARLYIDDSTRAKKVARVLTVGTPAWGSPKALFPLFAGVETPDVSTLDAFMNNDGLHEFAKNLYGAYYLYPTANYGTWLYNNSSPASQADVETLVSQLGGTVALLQQAEGVHASTLDSFPSGVDFEAIVGTGIPTISVVHILANNYLAIDYDNGDGTVPARSAARGPAGGSNPNAAHTHYACGVGHVPLPGDPQVTDAVEGYLTSGAKIKGLTTACPANGVQFRLFQLPNFVPTSAQPAADTLTVQDAQEQGLVDYLDLPQEKFVITGQTFPDVALPEGKFLEVTPLTDGAKGEPQLFGPLDGPVTISATDGVVTVSKDGQPLSPEGDSNCDRVVTAADALADLDYAAGVSTPGCLANADTNCDVSVTVTDAIDDLREFAGVRVLRDPNCAAASA